MYELDTAQRINKSFTITAIEEKALNTPENMSNDQYIDVYGYASRMYKDGNYVIDADQESVDTFGFDLKRLRNGTMPLLFNHDQQKPVGKIMEATYDKEGLLIKARVFKYPDDQLTNFVYNSVKSGVISAFSVGMLVKNFELISQDGEDYIQLAKSEVIEVSLVAVPSNPEALFQITNIKSIDGTEKTVTLLSKSMITPENPDVCNGFECAIKSQQKELLVQKELEMELEDKETILGVTPEASKELDIILNPEDTVQPTTEDSKPVVDTTVAPVNAEMQNVDTTNDKPSEAAKEELIVPTPEATVDDKLALVNTIDIANMDFDELDKIYENLSEFLGVIEDKIQTQAVAEAIRELTTVVPEV